MTINQPDISQHLLIQSRISYPRACVPQECIGTWALSLEKPYILVQHAPHMSLLLTCDSSGHNFVLRLHVICVWYLHVTTSLPQQPTGPATPPACPASQKG